MYVYIEIKKIFIFFLASLLAAAFSLKPAYLFNVITIMQFNKFLLL